MLWDFHIKQHCTILSTKKKIVQNSCIPKRQNHLKQIKYYTELTLFPAPQTKGKMREIDT